MTYEELVAKTKAFYKDADAKAVAEHVAVQFNIAGEAEGAFYVEVAEGKVMVEPFEYFDRDAIAYTSAAVVSEITDGKVTFADAVSNGSINVEGNILKALLLSDVKKAVKKAVAKKTESTAKKTVKKAEPKKTEAKKVEAPKAETKKVEAPKAEAKKVEAPKTEAKAAPAAKTQAAKTVKKTTKKK